jgi:hypothetical protein
MQTYSSTDYQLFVQTGGGDVVFNMGLSSNHGMDDETCAALVQTLRDFPWPTAMQPVGISAGKTFNTTDNYTCVVSATPPTFN